MFCSKVLFFKTLPIKNPKNIFFTIHWADTDDWSFPSGKLLQHFYHKICVITYFWRQNRFCHQQPRTVFRSPWTLRFSPERISISCFSTEDWRVLKTGISFYVVLPNVAHARRAALRAKACTTQFFTWKRSPIVNPCLVACRTQHDCSLAAAVESTSISTSPLMC